MIEMIDGLIKALGFKGYTVRKARWRSIRICCYCRMRIMEGFRVVIKITDDNEWIFEACSRDHAVKLIASVLGKELARRLSNPIYSDPRYASFLKLAKILSKRGYEYMSCDELTRIHVFPENDKPEVVIANSYPNELRILIDYIELKHRDFIASLLDEIAINFPDSDKELLLDLRHTPWYELNDAKKMALDLYCTYMSRGFKPSTPVRCGDDHG